MVFKAVELNRPSWDEEREVSEHGQVLIVVIQGPSPNQQQAHVGNWRKRTAAKVPPHPDQPEQKLWGGAQEPAILFFNTPQTILTPVPGGGSLLRTGRLGTAMAGEVWTVYPEVTIIVMRSD